LFYVEFNQGGFYLLSFDADPCENRMFIESKTFGYK